MELIKNVAVISFHSRERVFHKQINIENSGTDESNVKKVFRCKFFKAVYWSFLKVSSF